MDRPSLDSFAARHRLPAPALDAALALTGLRPEGAAWRAFAATLLRAAGVAGVGAGALFFVAANWQAWGLAGRFALLQVALLGCVAVALWRAPPAPAGQAALVLATLLAGGLLALFGQSYQTGADLHELFFTWALLALPFALAGLSGALWAVWWTVLNIGLALWCGWLGPEHFAWRLLDGRGIDHPTLLMLPCLVNLAGAAAFVALRNTRAALVAPPWLARYLASLGLSFGTAAVLMVVTSTWRHSTADAAGAGAGHGAAPVLLFAALSAGIAFAAWRRRTDVFPLALIAASWIAISTTALARAMRFDDIGAFFMIALWLIAASTAAGMLLMHCVRAWSDAPSTEGAIA